MQKLELSELELEEPEFEDPGLEEPEFEDPGLEEPEFEDPGLEEPEFEDPGLEEQPLENSESDLEPEVKLKFNQLSALSENSRALILSPLVPPASQPPSGFFGFLYQSTIVPAYNVVSVGLRTQMSNTVYKLTAQYLISKNSVFSANEETKQSIFVQRGDDIGIDGQSLVRTVGGFAANQASSYASAKLVAIAYDNIVGDVELQAEYELTSRLVQTFTENFSQDFALLQQSFVHIVNAIPVGFMNEVIAPMMAECLQNTPLGILFSKFSPTDPNALILKSLFNMPGQAGQALQCKGQGQYQGLIAKAIDALKIPGLGSMQDANSVANLYQAYIKLNILIPRFQAYYNDLVAIHPALKKIRDAVLKGPAAASFAIWWAQPSEPPQCIQDAMFLFNNMIALCVQKSNEMIPYIQAGRQGMFEVINPDDIAKQLVCATVNIGIYQAKQKSGQAVAFYANNFIDNYLNSAVYNSVVGPMSALVSDIAPTGLLNVGADMGITSVNVVKAMAVFDAPIKQSVILEVQSILKDLDTQYLSKIVKCSVLYATGVIDGGSSAMVVVSAVLTLPELLKHFTRVTSEVFLHNALNKASSQQMIQDIQTSLSRIIQLCLVAHEPQLMLENVAEEKAVVISSAVVVQPLQPAHLTHAKEMGKKIGAQINKRLPESLNTFGQNMGILGNISDGILCPQSATERMTSAVNIVLAPFLAHVNKGRGREARLNRFRNGNS